MFLKHILNLIPFYETPGDGGGGGNELSQDLSDLNDEGGDDDRDSDTGDGGRRADRGSEDDAGEGEEVEGEDEEGDERDEEEDEDELDADGKKKVVKAKKEGEEDEEEEPTGRVTFKQLRTEYPDLFKKHPELRSAFFEHPQFVEIFPDIDSAREASIKSAEYDALEASIAGRGDPKALLETLAENRPRALKAFVENFAQSVREIDTDLYRTIATPVIEELLYLASGHGKKIGGKQGQNLELAARHIANFVFANGGEIPDVSKRNSRSQDEAENPEREELERERREFARERFTSALVTIENQATPELNRVISNKLQELTPFERKTVIKETRREVDRLLLEDRAFQAQLKGLWRRAHNDGYSETSNTNIRRAWLERAKALAPKVRNRLKQEALDGRREGSHRENSEGEGKKRQFSSSGGRSHAGRPSGLSDPKKISWGKTSDMDIINS